ncbi:TatD family hydrolase [Glaciecola sp. 1036]|uniref:TatD family hydrolase n=1 Tax=Alteromonadaceae TaxID=72275 RepID=UPI003CFF650B
MIDSHCHIDLPAFDTDRAEVLNKAKSLAVSKLLVPGLHLWQFDTLLDLQAIYPELDICFGLHPYFLRQHAPVDSKNKITSLAEKVSQHVNQIVAIGETGLDAVIDVPMVEQIELLEAQIAIAKTFNKPLVLHHRQSHNELIQVLKSTRFSLGGSIHAFSGSYEIAKTYLDLGFVLGVGGTITYARAKKTRQAIAKVGIQHLVLETDAPDMPIFGFQGQRNTPERLPLIVDALSDLLHIDSKTIKNISTENYQRTFSSPIK